MSLHALLTASDETLVTISRAQREADSVREWPSYEVHPIGGLWSELQGYRVRLVSGPILEETDGITYPDYSAALAARCAG